MVGAVQVPLAVQADLEAVALAASVEAVEVHSGVGEPQGVGNS